MLNTTNKVTDASKLIAVADASFVIGISLCQQWDTLKALVETLIIADKVWEEVVERGEGRPGEKNYDRRLLLKSELFLIHQQLQC